MKLAKRLGITEEECALFLEAGFALLMAGRVDEAAEIFTGYMDIMPKSEIPIVGMARCFMWTGMIKNAEHWIKKALDIKRDSQLAVFTKAEILLMQGRKEDSRRLLDSFKDMELQRGFLRWKEELFKLMDLTMLESISRKR